MRDLQSAEEVDDLIRLVGPETMKQAGAQYINDAIKAGYKTLSDGSSSQWNPQTFIKKLGLLDSGAEQRGVTIALLEKTGAEIGIDDLDDIATVLQLMQSVEIPNVSTYLARRGGIGGAKTVLNAVAPGMGQVISAGVAGGGGAGIAAGAPLLSLLGVASFIGANQFMFRKFITDPKAAQLLLTVMDQEAKMLVKATAYHNLVQNVLVATAHEFASAGQGLVKKGREMTRGSLMPGQEAANEEATLKDYQQSVDDWNAMMKAELESRGEVSQEEIDAFFGPQRKSKKRKVR